MLTSDQKRQLRQLEHELWRSDPWLAQSLTAHGLARRPPQHRLARRPVRQWLAHTTERALAAWMDAAARVNYLWRGDRWF